MTIERIYNVAWDQSNLLNAIADEEANQRDVAAFYADCVIADVQARQQGTQRADWKAINRAIVARWPKGLNRVKEMAWKLLKPANPGPITPTAKGGDQ